MYILINNHPTLLLFWIMLIYKYLMFMPKINTMHLVHNKLTVYMNRISRVSITGKLGREVESCMPSDVLPTQCITNKCGLLWRYLGLPCAGVHSLLSPFPSRGFYMANRFRRDILDDLLLRDSLNLCWCTLTTLPNVQPALISSWFTTIAFFPQRWKKNSWDRINTWYHHCFNWF